MKNIFGSSLQISCLEARAPLGRLQKGVLKIPKKKELFDKPDSKHYGTWYRGISYWLFIIQKNPCFIFRAHVTQNNRLELRVSTQKSVLNNIHRVPRYWLKHPKIYRFGLATRFFAHFA